MDLIELTGLALDRTEQGVDGLGLGAVVVRGACTVGVDVIDLGGAMPALSRQRRMAWTWPETCGAVMW